MKSLSILKKHTQIFCKIFLFSILYSQNYSLEFPDFSIAHATDTYKDTKYLNSVDSFEYSYNQGARVFEMDFKTTSDNKVIAFHGGASFEKLMGMPPKFTYTDWTNTSKYPSPFNVQKIDLPNIS